MNDTYEPPLVERELRKGSHWPVVVWKGLHVDIKPPHRQGACLLT